MKRYHTARVSSARTSKSTSGSSYEEPLPYRHSSVLLPLLSLLVITLGVTWVTGVPPAGAHCQVPCGIYDDAARIAQLKEDSTTIAKAIAGIEALSSQHDAKSLNQAVRWVNTKEQHASHIIEIVAEYFLTQKVKPVEPGADGYEAYLKTLADHHAVMVAAMKTKQDANTATVDALNKAIETLAGHY